MCAGLCVFVCVGLCVSAYVCVCVGVFMRVCVCARARLRLCARVRLSCPRCPTHVGYSEYSNGVLGVLTQGTGSTHSGTRHRPVGVLSTMDRDAWAVARAELEANATNAKVSEYPSSTPSVPLENPSSAFEYPYYSSKTPRVLSREEN